MTNIDLLTVLDTEPWYTMLAIADQAEENGDAALAAGWRWLVARRKAPVRERFWQWGSESGHTHIYGSTNSAWRLPETVMDWLCAERLRIGRHSWEFSSCSEACCAAARALATLVQRGVNIDTLGDV